MKITHTILRKIIQEEIAKVNEAEQEFKGLTVSAVGAGDQEVVSMTWENNPGIDMIIQTLVSTYMELPNVVRLDIIDGKDWLMSNINDVKDRGALATAREAFGMDRFSPDEREQDYYLENPRDDI